MSPVLEDVDVVVPDRRICEREGDFTAVGRRFLDQLIDAGVDVLAVALVDRAFAEGDAPVVVRNNFEEIRGIGVGNELSFVRIEPNTDLPVAGVGGMQAEIGWLTLAHEVTAREAVALLAVATRRAYDAGQIAPSRVNRVYGRVERAAAPHGIRFRW